MGLLDDAIREHLELKRLHGADPTEVARQENEALGPARRAAPVERELAPEPEAEAEVEPVDIEPEPDVEPLDDEPTVRRIDPDIVEQPTMEHPSARPEPLDEDEIFAMEPMPEPERAPEPEPEPQAAAEDGDVLEGTPEFLEETPEHDRLWFEQRPPRDFDFDD